jgi:chromosome segregation protein
MSDRNLEIYSHGSCWIRADFHLHTNADKEFNYKDDINYYYSGYVKGLEDAGITLGVITNHNKFDYEEFKALQKTARNKEIFLLPGVELSVGDGTNGIHTLIIFSEEWLANRKDFINQFLNVIFAGKASDEFENENGRCESNLIETIKKLESYHKDFFLIFAHVEDRCGLWRELDGGRLSELGKKEHFRNRGLGFQKVRTHDIEGHKCRKQVKSWLEDAYPAEVEGSDCKNIEEIGKGKPCYLKIGYPSFRAVKYALMDHENRIKIKLKTYSHSHIEEVSYEGGVLDGKTIKLSPELNTLIGIRGSGKSSILESIRYAFDIPFGLEAMDKDYKNSLIKHVLGSGGKITIKAVDRRGQLYEIRRIFGENPDVYIDGEIYPGISLRETILYRPIYFGQKDLSASGEGFEKDLVEKLTGEKLRDIRIKIDSQKQKVKESVDKLMKLSSLAEEIEDNKKTKFDAKFKLSLYNDSGIEEEMDKQISFEKDSKKCRDIIITVENYLSELEEFIQNHKDDLVNQKVYTTIYNQEFFSELFMEYEKLIVLFSQLYTIQIGSKEVLNTLVSKSAEFEIQKSSLKETFAETERKLSEELRQSGQQGLEPDEFRQLRKTIDQTTKMLEVLEGKRGIRIVRKSELEKEIAQLNEYWHDEYKLILGEIKKVNANNDNLEIKAEFKGAKKKFTGIMKDVFRGSNIREKTYLSIADKFSDFGSIYKNMNSAKNTVGNTAEVFEKYFSDNLSTLLTWQIPNQFVIKYRGKDLKHHSLGQRASALILFVLSQRENDLIIIDQPEDDLDNQTIYEDVIKLIRVIKPKTQFIFATHNANFPVLGDAEQAISCNYSDDKINLKMGSIDNPELQREIVNIMEGGEEAFLKRKRRYEVWKSQN